MSPVLYDITSAWLRRPLPPAEVAAKFFRTLDSLGEIDPALKNWSGSDDYDGENQYSLASVRANMAAWVGDHVAHDDYGKDARLGYSVFGVSGREPDPEPVARQALFGLQAGSAFKNYYMFEIGAIRHPPDPQLSTFPLYKAVLLSLIAIWPAPWANARCTIWGERPPTLPGELPFPYSGYQMPWISYLCAERAAKVVVPSEVTSERTADGGLLMIAAQTRFDPANIEHMRRSRQIAEIMIEHGGNPGF
jgi:hypothetical protein